MRTRDIDPGFDLEYIRKVVDNETWLESWQDPDLEGRGIFLGTVFALLPSGKYYMPFACSNVDLCPRCHGKGETRNGKVCTWCDGLGSREAYLDQVWYDRADAALERVGLYLEHGEGDPCDIFAVEYREKD